MLTLEEANERLTAAGEVHEIETLEIRGVHTRVWKNAPSSLRDLLIASRQHGARDFLVYEGERLDFEQHFQRVARLATLLVDRWGVAKGERVAIAMRNLPEWSVAFWAATSVGAVAVPLNAWWQGRELRYGLEDSGSVVLIADDERAARVEPLLDGLPLRARVVTRRGGDELNEGWTRWDEVVEEAAAEDGLELPAVSIDPEDDATIFYTSGTTGFPKGALGTHRNICTNFMTADFLRTRAELRSGLTPPADQQLAFVLSVPLFHVTGCHSTMVPALGTGSKLILSYRFDPEETLATIERERATSFGGVPTLVWKVLECEAFGRYDCSSLRRIGYGGAPAAPELVRRIQEAFPGAVPSNGYGLTETSAITSTNAGGDYLTKPESVGPAVPVCRVKVVDGEGVELGAGEVGELWIHGPNVIKGYWNKPEATAETFTDGWLHSGDLARLDEDGFIYIVDRAKDMVIRGGENIYCVEVESALYEHPEVVGVAVFGVPHRVLGEEVAAAIQLRRDVEIAAGTLTDFAAERLASFKIPVHWAIGHEPLPLNANGKVLKTEVRSALVERLESVGQMRAKTSHA